MKVNFCIQLLCLLQGGLLAAGKLIPGEVSSLQQLDYDGASRLTQQWILYTAACESRIRGSPVLMESPLINVAQMGPEVVVLFRADHSSEGCVAARLVKGMTPVTAATPLHGDSIQGIEGIEEWISNMLRVEMGWVSYWKGDCTVFWIDHDGNRVPVSRLKPRESNTFWTQSFLGHIFEIADASSGELVGRYVAEYDSFNVVGDHVLAPLDYADPTAQIERELHSVYHETSAVKRTFSELGFQHGKLPADVWGSISSYYYNNREHKTFEEQVGASVFINWWEANCYFIGMPWGLKGRWQARLLTLVQDWIGGDIPLEQTDIYGIRRYERGARLLSHVDRITTHAVSLIINVAQEDMKEPWMVEIYDFAGRLHEIEMQPGDIVYYESARCLHGRMTPLNGSHYVNIFSHYRPVGDARWYTRENPPGTPPPLVDVGECRSDGHASHCEKARMPYLSPTLETLKGPSDLFKWWRRVSPPNSEGPGTEDPPDL